MPRFIVDINLDGYDTIEEEIEACMIFIRESLDFSASSVDVEIYEEDALVKFYEEVGTPISDAIEDIIDIVEDRIRCDECGVLGSHLRNCPTLYSGKF